MRNYVRTQAPCKFAQVNLHFSRDCLAGVKRSEAKNAQEAHEAIRPTEAEMHPEYIDDVLSSRKLSRLYGLIWARAIASQMASAKLLQVLFCSDARLHFTSIT